MKLKNRWLLNSISMNFTKLILLGAIIALSGCGTAKPQPTLKTPPPKWITQIPQDTSTKIYGIATESNRDLAIKSALSDLIAKLGVSIESTFSSVVKVSKHTTASNTKNAISSSVSEIKINNYQVVKSYKLSYREFVVLVVSDKQELFRGIQENLKKSKSDINIELKNLKNLNAVSRYNKAKELSKKADSMLSKTLIAYELNRSFTKEQYLKFIDDVNAVYNKEKNSLNFYIKADKNSKHFKEVVANYLSQNNYRVVSSKKRNSVVLEINSSDNANFKRSVISIYLKVSLRDGKTKVGGKSFTLKQRYDSSRSKIYNRASIDLKKDINSLGINELLGINLDN